jgi:Tol biopolymer transport system component
VQVDNTPCAWTGPWAITPDGRQIAFHNPGPTQSMSDTGQEKGSPLYLARSDGMSPVKLFPSAPGGMGFITPLISPDGRYINGWDTASVAFERLAGGAIFTAPEKYMWPEWTTIPDYVILYNEGATDYYQHPALYNIATGAKAPLQVGSFHYVWAPSA